jgi:hypothetical protein
MTSDERAQALLYLSRFIGTEVPAAFLQKTSEHCAPAGIPYIHPLQEGIYKPKGSPHAFCIWSRSAMGGASAVYPDALRVDENGTWRMDYAPKEGSLDSAVNRSLFAVMADRLPVLVIATSQPKEAPGGARYRILGLAVIESFDSMAGVFVLRGASPAVLAGLRDVQPDEEELARVEIREQLILPMALSEPRSVYVASRTVRTRAFGSIVLEEYRRQCCVCGALFVLRESGRGTLVEAEAAHIIPVRENGPDDPRNGMSLCRRHHWAFDAGLFTVTDGLLVRLSPAVARAEQRKFDLEEYDGEPVARPARESCVPDLRALEWHQERVFRAA